MYDGWMPYPPAAAQYAEGLAAVRSAAAAAGRSADEVTPALFVSVAVTGSVEQGHSQLAEFAQASYGLPLADLEQIQALAAGPLDVVADKLDRYVAAGARHLAVRIATTTLATQRDQLEQIIKLKHMLNQAASGTNPGRASTAPADPGTGLPGRRVS
jgi:alkanesulfonate monooxygenase SsuD/methylene tetrahydromethanopterin reductase-like flavin-dependent oxidoreductase (luciferase family)